MPLSKSVSMRDVMGEWKKYYVHITHGIPVSIFYYIPGTKYLCAVVHKGLGNWNDDWKVLDSVVVRNQ